MKYCIGMLMGLLLLAGSSFADDTLIFSGTNWPPYEYEEEGVAKGIVVEIVREAARQLELQIEIRFLPWKRALKDAETGKVDGVVSAMYTEERGDFLYFTSEALFAVNTVIFAPKDSPLSDLSSLEALQGKHVGVVSGYSYGAEFDSFPDLKKYTCNGNDALVQNLAKGRVDVAVAHEYAFKFYSRKHNLQDASQVIYRLNNDASYLTFSKTLGERGQQLTNEFSRVLGEMKTNGTIERIMQTHLR